MKNKLCRAKADFDCKTSLFSTFEIVTVREYNDYNGGTYLDEVNTIAEFLDTANAYDEPFYRVYGIYKNSMPVSRKFICDFYDIEQAVSFLHDLTGKTIQLISY